MSQLTHLSSRQTLITADHPGPLQFRSAALGIEMLLPGVGYLEGERKPLPSETTSGSDAVLSAQAQNSILQGFAGGIWACIGS